MAGTRSTRQSIDAQRKAARLAELVAGLTGCETTGALHAVREHQDEERPDALGLVARAMIDVDAPTPEGFRVAGFLKDEAGDHTHVVLPDVHPSADLVEQSARFVRRGALPRRRRLDLREHAGDATVDLTDGHRS